MTFIGSTGGQQAVRDHHRLIGLLSKYLGLILGTLLTLISMIGLHKLILRPIEPTVAGEVPPQKPIHVHAPMLLTTAASTERHREFSGSCCSCCQALQVAQQPTRGDWDEMALQQLVASCSVWQHHCQRRCSILSGSTGLPANLLPSCKGPRPGVAIQLKSGFMSCELHAQVEPRDMRAATASLLSAADIIKNQNYFTAWAYFQFPWWLIASA